MREVARDLGHHLARARCRPRPRGRSRPARAPSPGARSTSGAPEQRDRAVTSMNASSSDSGSTSGLTLLEDRADLRARRGGTSPCRRGDDHGVRAERTRLRRGHRRAHAEGPRLVRRRRDHAALRRAAHDDRPAAQLGTVALLDRRVERVHVGVQDDRRHAEALASAASVATSGAGSTARSAGARPPAWRSSARSASSGGIR